jgi:hypothetical protein
MAAARKRTTVQTYPAAWVVQTTARLNGQTVTPGQMLSISGERGRFRFEKHVLNTANGAEWISVVGGPEGCTMWRDFRPGRVRTVHRRK